jgi:phosphatidylglycerol:prolipoprotein diacylglycerol transferase
MHPVLFEFNTPEFLSGFFPDSITVYTYGFLIACGAVAGFAHTAYMARKQFGVPADTVQTLIILIIVAAVIGGKVFIVFEDPGMYLSKPSRLLENFSNGFVFYGSLLFAIPTMLIFFRKKNLPTLGMLDIMAVTTCIVHAFGRMGCFMAGCCFGKPSDGFFSITFTHPQCAADPLNTPLHPTQLYSAIMILGILFVLIVVQKRKAFDGQLFMLYLMLYALGRSVLEIFRGDLERGFIIEGVVSNSQFISLLVFVAALIVYIKLAKNHQNPTAP